MADWFSKQETVKTTRHYLAVNMQKAPLPADTDKPGSSAYATFVCKLRSRAWFNHQVTSLESTILVLIGNADDGESSRMPQFMNNPTRPLQRPLSLACAPTRMYPASHALLLLPALQVVPHMWTGQRPSTSLLGSR
jgi:hypothetical protein